MGTRDPSRTTTAGRVKRILFTESSRNVGGQELQLLAQMAGLAARGVETRLACNPAGRLDAVARARGIAPVAVPFRNSVHPPSIVRLVRLMRDLRPDAVITHSGHDASIASIAARLVRPRPVLVRARTYQHGVPSAWPSEMPAGMRTLSLRFLGTRPLPRQDSQNSLTTLPRPAQAGQVVTMRNMPPRPVCWTLP